MSSPGSPIVGIDLGTTLSSVAVLDGGEVRLLPNDLGEVLTPSVVAHDARAGGLTVGRIAKDILAREPAAAVANFKRDMGQDRPFTIGGNRYTPVELSAYVLDTLRGDAERALGRAVTRCVVTVPAYFNEAQRVATKHAAQMAGFAVERVLNEPTAAAIAYGLHEGDEPKTFLVFDLGGGTFDVCVMERFEGMLEVRSVAGESRLGGEDFTAAVADLALRTAGFEVRLHEIADAAVRARIHRRAELLKRQLARWPSGEINLPPIGRSASSAVTLPAEAVEAAYAPLLERMIGPCRAALRGASLSPDELDAVLLVGGATRLPAVQRLARDLFRREPDQQDDPDLAVVRGAAVQAALCNEDAAVGDLVVTDVLSHSLGVDSVRRVGAHDVAGYFSPVIHRNSVIPTSRTETFETVYDRQTRMDFTIYEGEARRVEGNRKIGELVVKGIPRGPRGQEVELTFSYDLDGILEVEAQIPGTEKRFTKLLDRNERGLSADRVTAAQERIRALKADPRERPRYRDLLGRANLLWSEISGDPRSILGAAIDNFEAALTARTPRLIEEAAQVLGDLCQQIDKGIRW